jgi:hypothetical protein
VKCTRLVPFSYFLHLLEGDAYAFGETSLAEISPCACPADSFADGEFAVVGIHTCHVRLGAAHEKGPRTARRSRGRCRVGDSRHFAGP